MKKCIAIALVLVVAVSATFALDFDMSAGVGAVFDYSSISSDFGDDTSTAFGVKGFFDVTYAQVSVAYLITEEGMDNVLDLSLLFKYPFDMSSFKLFPMVGVGYLMNPSNSGANAISVKAGVGADIDFMENLYIRPTAIVGYQVSSDALDAIDSLSIIDVEIGVAIGFKF